MKEMNWRVNWTCDNRHDVWHVKLFSGLKETRDFADALVSKYEENPHFNFFVERMCLVSSCDVLDNTISAGAIRLA